MLAKWIALHAPVIQLPGWCWYKNWQGFATPFAIFVKHKELPLIWHEQAHVYQMWRGWLIGFALRYLWYNYQHGYRNNPYEVLARQCARGEIELRETRGV